MDFFKINILIQVCKNNRGKKEQEPEWEGEWKQCIEI